MRASSPAERPRRAADEEGGREHRSWDADVDRGLISTASPIGRALLNKEEGDEVTVTAPNGSRRFELVKLLTIHDDEG